MSKGIHRIRKILLGSVPVVAAIGGAPAIAQSANDEIQEIVVTANKREESVNKVGLSITALKGTDLRDAGVASPADLAKLVPGFTVTQNSYGSGPIYTMRGIGFNDNAAGGAPTVGVYVDEVPLPYPILTLGAQLDVQRVEALKGPQGVLFGNNTTGGAINYIAASPTSNFSAGATVDVGSFGRIDGEGYISGPISDSLLFRASVRSENGGAWQKSQSRPGDRLGSKDNLFGRIIFDWRPTSDLSVRLNLNGWSDRSDTRAPQAVAEDLVLPLGVLPPLSAAYQINGGPDGAVSDNRQADWNPSTRYQNDNKFKQGSLRINYNIAELSTITSITSWSDFKRDSLADNDGTNFQSTDVRSYGRIKSFFQELRISSDLTDRLNVLAGVNYARDVVRDNVLLGGHVSTLAFLDAILPGFPSDSIGTYSGLVNEVHTKIKTLAGFVKADYRLTDTLKILGAVRYTDDKRDGTACSYDRGSGGLAAAQSFLTYGDYTLIPPGPAACFTLLPGSTTPGLVPLRLHQNNISWRAGVEWQYANNALFYATVNKAIRRVAFRSW
jgi:iron complex outermembrane recepter protein